MSAGSPRPRSRALLFSLSLIGAAVGLLFALSTTPASQCATDGTGGTCHAVHTYTIWASMVAGGAVAGCLIGWILQAVLSSPGGALVLERGRRRAARPTAATRRDTAPKQQGYESAERAPSWGMAGRPSAGWRAQGDHAPSFSRVACREADVLPAALAAVVTPAGQVPARLAASSTPARPPSPPARPAPRLRP